MHNYLTLTKKFATLGALRDAASILQWDANVLMPLPAAKFRANQLAAIKSCVLNCVNDRANLDLIEAAKDEALSEVDRANLAEIEYQVKAALAINNDLMIEYERAKLNTEVLWREAKSANNFKLVEKELSSLFILNLQIAEAQADAFCITPYQAMINNYDRGLDEKTMDSIFDNIIRDIPSLLPKNQKSKRSTGFSMKKEDQIMLIHELSKIIGLRSDQLMIKESLHPFCGGNPYDNRITVVYLEDNLAQTILALIHEAGHALYEQNLPLEFIDQPVGNIRGMAMHESQSLFFEKHVASSKEFSIWLSKFICQILPHYSFSSESLYSEFNTAQASLIRIFADELTYPLHVAIRYFIEKNLVNQEIEVSDIPTIWDDMYEKYLGIRPKNQSEGCLQDIHWYSGSFGYFPSYTAGAIIASMIEAKLKNCIPDFAKKLMIADFKEINQWLNENIHEKASTLSLQEILVKAVGHSLNYDCYFNYLQNKFCGEKTL